MQNRTLYYVRANKLYTVVTPALKRNVCNYSHFLVTITELESKYDTVTSIKYTKSVVVILQLLYNLY